jgi:hypothetical protein
VRAHPSVWWHPSKVTTTLEYDGSLAHAVTVPAGLATSEDDVLHVWRTDVQGPESVPLVTDLPIGVPIVLDGSRLTVEGTQRFSLRVRYAWSKDSHSRSPQYNAWRTPTTRDEAVVIRDRLLARVFDGPLPEVAREGTYDECTRRLAQMPLAETVDLFGKSLFASSTLDPETLPYVIQARRAFLDELADALGTSARQLLACLRARKTKLEPPRIALGFEYLGTFTTSGALVVADPCYLGRKSTPVFELTQKADGLEGLWHAFVRPHAGDADRNAELVAVHENAFDVYASDEIGSIGVDAGCVGVFDKQCPKPNLDYGIDEGIVSGLAVVVSSGYGDGMYPVFVGKSAGKVSKIRAVFIDDAPEVDHFVLQPAGAAAKPYNAKTKFAAGDTIDHVKFGLGAVVRVGADGKIDVRFTDGTRTLIHAKK